MTASLTREAAMLPTSRPGPGVDEPPPSELLALGVVACPRCKSPLVAVDAGTRCPSCDTVFPFVHGVLDLRPRDRRAVQEDEQWWASHWSDDRQETLVQRFFSFYRKAVFARTVRHFVHRYLPADGVLLEAGSGTAESSMRIDHRQRRRRLIALDLIPAVLVRTHPVMEFRVAGDLFHLPFANDALHGLWNVGVMEHFTHEQIDTILAECHRVLRPGGRILLLWPGTDSLPQKALDAVARLVNRVRGTRADAAFRFHPPEISRLRSTGHGFEVLARNGFAPIAGDGGLRSLFAFKTVVAEKRAPVSRTS